MMIRITAANTDIGAREIGILVPLPCRRAAGVSKLVLKTIEKPVTSVVNAGGGEATVAEAPPKSQIANRNSQISDEPPPPGLLPESILATVACACSSWDVHPRRHTPRRAMAALQASSRLVYQPDATWVARPWSIGRTFRIFAFAEYVKMIVAGVGILLVLLAWPTNRDATGIPRSITPRCR